MNEQNIVFKHSNICNRNCSTQIANKKQALKKRIKIIPNSSITKLYYIYILLILCVSLIGCTFNDTETQETTLSTELLENSTRDKTEIDFIESASTIKTTDSGNSSSNKGSTNNQLESLPDADTSQENLAKNATQAEEDIIYNNVPLYYNQKENQVCIEVQPSIIRPYISYYYIPTGEVQERLIELVHSLKLEAKPFDYRWKGMKESGWKLCYQDLKLTAFDGGYLYCCWEDFETNSSMEYLLQDSTLYNEIQSILKDTLNYEPFDITNIKNIVSAKLEVQNMFTDYKLCSQTITNQETLQILEDLFSSADYIYGGAECGNQGACLELILADGKTVKLSMAIDSCTNCGINGVYYDYRPVENRKKGGWYSTNFFQYFDELLPFLPL